MNPKPNPNLMLCRHLNTKKMFLPYEEEPDYAASSTSVFWCTMTSDVVGRDDCPVCPEGCGDPTRSCYENNDVLNQPKRPPVA